MRYASTADPNEGTGFESASMSTYANVDVNIDINVNGYGHEYRYQHLYLYGYRHETNIINCDIARDIDIVIYVDTNTDICMDININIDIDPNIDMDRAWKIASQNQNVAEYVRVQLWMMPAWKERKQIKWNPQEFKMSTTINLTDIFTR